MNLRLAAAVSAAKLTAITLRTLRRGGGTALPGLVALKLAPGTVKALGSQLQLGAVLVTGTNGKTTTSRMLASIARAADMPILHNREGSNLNRGIASALVACSSAGGRLSEPGSVGIFEVDEATMPEAAGALAPRSMAFTNLFRDQLDRYGEVDTVFALWREAVEAAGPGSTLILNADDPSVAELEIDHRGPVEWFGIDDPGQHSEAGGASDARWCRDCGGTFAYDIRYFAHVGHWRCQGCSRIRPVPGTVATNLALTMDGATFEVAGIGTISMPLTGLYNVYNALAAIALAKTLGIQPAAIVSGLATVEAAFGRQEVLEVAGRRVRIMLAKNPAGANQVLRLLASVDAAQLNLGLMLNDRFADGRDVSWIWDVDYELLAPRVARWGVAGDRARDLALRLTYGGWPATDLIATTPGELLDGLLRAVPAGEEIILLPTYTAMLDLREELVRRGVASRFWDS